MHLVSEPGILGMFTREQAPGAIENGARIRKISSEPKDAHPTGSLGTVLGSVRIRPHDPRVQHFYFVTWDTQPYAAVGVCDFKIGRAL